MNKKHEQMMQIRNLNADIKNLNHSNKILRKKLDEALAMIDELESINRELKQANQVLTNKINEPFSPLWFGHKMIKDNQTIVKLNKKDKSNELNRRLVS